MKNQSRTYLTFLLFLTSFLGYCQQGLIARYDSIIQTDMNNREKLLNIEELLQDKEKFDPVDLAAVYYEFSKWCYLKIDDDIRAQNYAKKEYEIRSSLNEVDDSFKKNLYNLGYMYHHSNFPNYDAALSYFSELVAVSDESERRLGNAFREMGDIYDALGDFRNALDHYEKSENIFKSQKNYRPLLSTYVNIAGLYVETNDSTFIEPFFRNLDKVKALEEQIELPDKQQAMLLFNTAAMIRTTTNHKEAIVPAKEALSLFMENKDSLNIFKTLGLLGNLEKREGNFSEAESLFISSKKYTKGDPLRESSILNNIGDVYKLKGNQLLAVEKFEEAVATLLQISGEDKTVALKELVAQGTLLHKKHLLDYLIDLANGWFEFYKSSSNDDHLAKADEITTIADTLIDQLYFESREELSKLSWRKKGGQLYTQAVQICYSLDNREKAFYYMEKNKGLFLLENVSLLQVRHLSGVPSSIVDREYTLLNRIKLAQRNLESQGSSPDRPTQGIDSLKNHLFALKNDYKLYVDSLQQEFPSYYRIKRELEIVGLKELQRQLEVDEYVIEYIVGEEKAHAIFISKGKIELVELADVPLMTEKINEFQQFLRAPFRTREEINSYKQLASDLYTLLLPFKSYKRIPDGSRISIVADGIIQTIPFEALITSAEKEIEEAYLLNKHLISYKYSMSVEAKFEAFENPSVTGGVAFLPSMYLNNYLPALYASGMEKEAIANYFEHQPFEGVKATKGEFLSQYNQNSVLHISTHGGVDNGKPWLAFYDERLYLGELFFVRNQKNLVVLSACKTSAGTMIEGEGQLNLTRGFINSGARSVVSTLWDVNEKSSVEIISSFYKSLNQGASKSEALQTAKLAYLKNHLHTSEASPYYWSAIILTGADDQLEGSLHSDLWLYGLAFVVIAFALFAFKRRIVRS